MALLLAAVGGFSLMGTMSLNVLERTREIGVMRAIGASNGSVLQIFLVEGLLIGLISWCFAALFGLPMSRLLSDAIGEALLRWPLNFAFSIWGVLLWLGLVLVISAVSSLLPARHASRLTVREVLSYE
jgi:putative ABC transport system permease protein